MSVESQQPSTRVRGHGEFLLLWESNAPLTDDQVKLCSKAEAHFSSLRHFATSANANPKPEQPSGKDPPKDAKPEAPVALPVEEQTSYKGVDGLKGLATVTTPEEFHEWHDEMEKRLKDANEEKYRTLIENLTSDREVVAKLLESVNKSFGALENIVSGREFISEVMANFKSDCENMVSDRKKMGELADALRKRLTYFEELETLTAKLGGSGADAVDPNHPEFVKLLHRLDECVAYASSSTGAVAEADGYLARFLELQRRAFTAVRDNTIGTLRNTAAQVAKELRDDRLSGAGFRHADLTDASKEYLRFRTVAPRVKLLMSELHSRAISMEASSPTSATARARGSNRRSSIDRGKKAIADPYSNPAYSAISDAPGSPTQSSRATAVTLYSDCEECFFEQRKRLLEPSVAAHVKSLADVKNMIALARLGSAYVLRVCELERQLYEHFFPVEGSSADDNPMLLSALRGLCDMVYTELRPQILQEDDLDKLVYLIEVLKTEILGDEVPRRGFAGKAFAPSVIRTVADAQERIIYRSEVYMRDEIRSFIPGPEHLNYPERILEHRKLVDGEAKKTADRSNGKENGSDGKDVSKDVRSMGIYATWYPPVERTLRLLSMLYRCVEGEVFAGVAQEAVATCVQSVGSAAARIAATDKPNAEDHAQLFLVWQLLMTREQISPFDVEMSYTEHELDFFELRSLLGSVIRGQISARSLATRPTVREKKVDSKRDLDHGVRGACESFILKTTRLLLDPVLSFLAKCNALPANKQPAQPAREDDGEGPPTPLAAPFDALKRNSGSFAHPDRLRASWNKVTTAVSEELPQVVARMKIYISKAASRAVLLRPIRSNIAEAATELLSALQLRYNLEEREAIGIDGAEVERLLEEVDSIMGFGARTPRASSSS